MIKVIDQNLFTSYSNYQFYYKQTAPWQHYGMLQPEWHGHAKPWRKWSSTLFYDFCRSLPRNRNVIQQHFIRLRTLCVPSRPDTFVDIKFAFFHPAIFDKGLQNISSIARNFTLLDCREAFPPQCSPIDVAFGWLFKHVLKERLTVEIKQRQARYISLRLELSDFLWFHFWHVKCIKSLAITLPKCAVCRKNPMYLIFLAFQLFNNILQVYFPFDFILTLASLLVELSLHNVWSPDNKCTYKLSNL